MKGEPEMLCILGPTATGKTRLAVAVARRIDGEIISADSRQVYRGMDIGTGKDLGEYREGGVQVPYHLIDIVNPGYEFNVFEFQKAFQKAYKKIKGRGTVPILCGGTGLYLEAALEGYHLEKVPVNEELRRELAGLGQDDLVRRLAASRKLHNTTDTTDRERLIRAVEIAENEGKAVRDPFPAVSAMVFGLRLDRAALRRRIGRRLRNRLGEGLVEEVRRLMDEGLSPESLDFYGLEYRYVTRYLVGRINRNDMVQKLESAIVDFAKRQEKWFRRMERKGRFIRWLNADQPVERLVEEVLGEAWVFRQGHSAESGG